jgi:aspartate--ammonia ligase
MVPSDTGVNDMLNGYERPVEFEVKETHRNLQIIQSLAKWKRIALKRYGFQQGTGLYTDMNAIRRDEETDNIHSIYVDQWDWEKIIKKEERTTEYLQKTVQDIFEVFKLTEEVLINAYPEKKLERTLPDKISFITSQELENLYPEKRPKEREHLIAKEKGAVFISQIGKKLKSGNTHDGRSPDYDDWELNGDIILWYEPLNISLELSSMGIRVDKNSLEKQLKEADAEDRKELLYHKMLLNDELPLTIGGGLGQSRICMYFMKTVHIGEVQSSVWPEEMVREFKRKGIEFL